MVPISTNEVCAGVRPRNLVISPIDSTPTIGQKSSSKKKKTLRDAISALRTTTAHTASASARQLNEDLLELGLAHAPVADSQPVGEQLAQQVGQALLRVVDRAPRPALRGRAAQYPGRFAEPRRCGRLDAEGDDVAEADAPLEVRRRPRVQDASGLDEGHLVTQLLCLA